MARKVTGIQENRQRVRRFALCGVIAAVVGAAATAMPLSGPQAQAVAYGPTMDPAKGYFSDEIRGGVHWITDGSLQAMFVVTDEGVIAVDAPRSIAENNLKAIAEVTDRPVTHVIYSHAHGRHIGDAHIFPDDAVYIAHEETAKILIGQNDPNIPLPSVTFSDNFTLEVGGQRLELSYPGVVTHVPGNIFIYAPEQKVLMLVDRITPGQMPNLQAATNIPGLIELHDQILDFDFDTFISGHGVVLGTPKGARLQREFIHDLRTNVIAAFEAVSPAPFMRKYGFDKPKLTFFRFHDAVAQNCAETTMAKWGDSAAIWAVESSTKEACARIISSLTGN